MVRAGRRSILILALGFSLLAQKVREIRPGFNLFSREQDVQLGKEAAREVERQVPVVRDRPELSGYVADLGTRLARVSQAPDYPYTFKVVAEKGINAFALPGGPVYVHAETIAAADNEAQLAGVVAHEISHVALRHSTQQLTKAYGVQIGLMLAGAAIGGGSLLGQLTQLGLGFGANSLLLKYSRDAERDADLVGARTMAAAGFDPVEMARFFEKLEAQGGGGRGLQFLSDHPNPGNRVRYVQDEVKLLPHRAYSKGSPDFTRYKEMAARIPASERRPGGAAGAGSGPAGDLWREFRGPGYRFQYPAKWQAYSSGTAENVTVAPPSAIAQTGRSTNLTMGVMAGYFPFRGNRLEAGTDELLQNLQRNNPGLRPLRGQRRPLTLDGVPAETILLEGQGELDTLVTALRPQGLFHLILIAPERDYNALRPVFDHIIGTLRFL